MGHRIVVIGAGYSGLAAAVRASRRLREAQVTLVNPIPRFVERVRLHQVAAGQQIREHSLAEIASRAGFEFVVGRVLSLDPDIRSLRLDSSGKPLEYDTLVYALGSGSPRNGIPGVAEHAMAVSGLDEAHEVRERLAGYAGQQAVVTVVGGGLTGIETAAELAESHPALRLRLLTDGEFTPGLSLRGRRYLRHVFDRLGIEVRSGTPVHEVGQSTVETGNAGTLDTDLTVWTAGFDVPEVARQAGLAVDDRGRVLVDGTLRSVSHPDIYAIGDSAVLRTRDNQVLRMACATGLPSGVYAARAIAARLSGRQPDPFGFRYLNQCISLGRRAGLVQFVDHHDRPRAAVLTGRTAARYKEFVVRGAQLVAHRPGIR